MDKEILKQWASLATQVCQLDNAREMERKHTGLCNLQRAIYNEMGAVLDGCLRDARNTSKGKIRFSTYWQEYNGIFRDSIARNCIDLLEHHLPKVEEWEADDSEMEGKRLEKLEQYKNQKIDNLEIKGWQWQPDGMGGARCDPIRVPNPDSIYCKNGLYRRFWELSCTEEYQILRELQAHKSRKDDLETLYKALMLYLSLSNEKAEVEALAKVLGTNLQEPTQSKPDLPQNALHPQSGAMPHPEQEIAPDVKLQRFLECVPTQSKKKAERLLQRVIKAGYCTANYEWVASKWKSSKSRLALACFCYLASNYLGLSERVDAEGKPTTNWKPFETLFEYEKKMPDQNGKHHQLADVKKQQCKYNEQERFYKCPEMIEIKKLFNN